MTTKGEETTIEEASRPMSRAVLAVGSLLDAPVWTEGKQLHISLANAIAPGVALTSLSCRSLAHYLLTVADELDDTAEPGPEVGDRVVLHPCGRRGRLVWKVGTKARVVIVNDDSITTWFGHACDLAPAPL